MSHRSIGDAGPNDELSAMLAHELRNPLAAIRSAVEIMRVIGQKDPALETARELISRQVDQLSRLVDQLLEVSRTTGDAGTNAIPSRTTEIAHSRTDQPSTPPGRETSRRIVVIDDNVDAAESLAMLLRLKGHEVHIAYDGPAGLALTMKTLPDCVLVDIGLPGIDGHEVAKRLRAHNRKTQTGRVLLVALTGYGQAEDRIRSKQAGFDHHLVKPVAHDVLEDLLRER